MVVPTVELRRASPVWALDNILVPVLYQGLAEGTVIRPPAWNSAAELSQSLKLLFGYGIEFLREEIPLTLTNLGSRLRMPTPRVLSLLGAIKDWHWLIDHVRLVPSEHGSLGLSGNVMVVKSDPHVRSGASIFGVDSRSLPEVVMKRLREHGLAPSYNHPSNSIATDCSVWLVEIGDGWSLALRVEPLIERTWFDPESYETGLRPYVEAVLEEVHGPYPASNLRVVRERLLDSYLGSVKEISGDASGLTFESGCLQHGELGKETSFVGGRLEQIMAVQGHGARPLFDLPRLPPHDPRVRGGKPWGAWSGTVTIGEEDCSFLLDDEDKPRSSWEMAWAAQMVLSSAEGPPHLRGIFRPASDRAVQKACEDPEQVRYVVAQAMVGKHGATRKQRVDTGFVVRDHRGEVSSGWSVPFGNVHNLTIQEEVISQGEGHLRRMAPDGEVENTMSYLRAAGVQENITRVLPQIQARHGLILTSDILNTRAALYV
jgi:hypothetical protein